MALVVYDRVQQTGTANTTVSFTLTGSVTGYQSFAVVGNGNTTYYAATDTTGNYEVGIGTYSTTGPTLTRTTILASSNSGSAVTFSGTVTVFVTYPAGKSVNLDASGNVTALGTIASGVWNGTTIPVAYGGTGVTSSSGANSVVLRDSNANISVNRLNQSSTTTTAAAGTTTLTAASTFSQILTGTGGQTFKLPDATTLTNTTAFQFNNNATGTLTIVDNASGAVGTVISGGAADIALLSNGTVAGTWDVHAYIPENVQWGTNSLVLGSTVITGGTWQGGTIASGYGGTGLTTFSAANNALYSTSASALAAGTLPAAAGGTGLTSPGASGNVLTSNGSAWVSSTPSSPSATYVRSSFTATAGQTTFSATYTVGYVEVYVNGVLLNGADYTASNGTTVVLAVGRATGDIVETIAYNTSSAVPTTGAIVWQSVQTGNFTAVSGRGYPVNTTSGAITVTLPSGPAAGAFVTIVDYAGTANTNNITVSGNGSNIQGTSTNVVIAANRQAYNFVYIDSTQGWISYAQEYNASPQPYSISYLIAAGGGGGGGSATNGGGGGGGGAGGLVTGTTSLVQSTIYTITVGAGGSGGVGASAPTASTNSTITGGSLSLTAAVAGGAGSYWNTSSTTQAATSGGSGGGGAFSTSNFGSGTSGQGFAGGASTASSAHGGGGGGSGAVGSNATTTVAGTGGIGSSNSITGSAVTYTAGGGGGAFTGGTAGAGGSSGVGGAGGSGVSGSDGTINTGSGGGGGGATASLAKNGGAGGKGVVILSIPTANYTGTTTGSPTVTTSGSNKILTFTSSGTYTA